MSDNNNNRKRTLADILDGEPTSKATKKTIKELEAERDAALERMDDAAVALEYVENKICDLQYHDDAKAKDVVVGLKQLEWNLSVIQRVSDEEHSDALQEIELEEIHEKTEAIKDRFGLE